ncbi:unnamed protein product [Parnassius mnemosyne]|uniref:Reverse transcriptase domain-containing protein n=1 Tax=Parnassius mnemosyne TaxID=213953 RepID=A0AAV1KF68_9NEOP
MAAFTPSGPAAVPPTIGCLEGIVRALPNTAPGLDGIGAKIVKNVWRAAPREFHWVYAKCVEEGVIPEVWKKGRLIVIPKGNDRPLTDPKAYRPITLLPIFGKLLERVLLRCAPSLVRGISEYQHGFSPGRSTVTALQDVLTTARESQRKYVQAVFLDISGAFDNAWWPMILLKAKQGGIPPNIYRMLVDYFINRRVGIFVGDCAEWKRSTMGCPQGSVLGPTLWNLLLDDLLRLPFPLGTKMLAYADDVTLLIEANSRAEIERAAKSALELVSSWGERNRLSFSSAKSCTMTIKGKFQRPPVIRMGTESVKSVTSTKVLGVTLDTTLFFIQHAKDMVERPGRCFGKMSQVSASSWDIRYPALRVLYKGTYVPIVTYAAAVWVDRVGNYTVRTTLLRS